MDPHSDDRADDGADDGAAAEARTRPWRNVMTGREPAEPFRTATPLELLFDLTFVVAIAQLATELAHSLADAHPADGLVGYLSVFFAIWWAWMNFTWFASAYDTDDVPYRLLTLLQMGGVLVLAAGVPSAYQDQNFVTVTIGYVLMRLAMVAQWLRAARADPAHRGTALRFAIGIGVVQLGWVLRLLLPERLDMVSFLLLVVAELSVPLWAERWRMTNWHPHHIAERYGLFTIIVLGEVVLAATTAVKAAVAERGLTLDLLLTSVGGLILLCALWWLYFLRSAGEGLTEHPERSFRWGYGHYAVFASLAALGAGLEAAAESLSHHVAASEMARALGVGVPAAVAVLAIWLVHLRVHDRCVVGPFWVLGATATMLLLAVVVGPTSAPLAILLTGLPVAALVAAGVRRDSAVARSPSASAGSAPG